jgi:hypothetical protein
MRNSALLQLTFFQQQHLNMVKFSFDGVEFDKTSGKVEHEEGANPNKEIVRLENFTGTVCWKKNQAGLEQDDDDSVEFIKDVMPPFQQQQGGLGGMMKTGISSMEKWSVSAPPVKPKAVAVKVEKSIKMEPAAAAAGAKKASIIKEPSEQTKKIISNAVKPPPVEVVKNKRAIKNKPTVAKKVEHPLDDSVMSHLESFDQSKAKSSSSSSSSSSESSDASMNRHHANLFGAAGRSEEKQDVRANLETMLVDDKEEKKAADDEVVDTVVQSKEPTTKKARGRPAAAVAAAAAPTAPTAPTAAPGAPGAPAAGNKNKKNNNKVNDAPPRTRVTRGAAARK